MMSDTSAGFYLESIFIPDLDRRALEDEIVRMAILRDRFFVFALHINALSEFQNPLYLAAIRLKGLSYVDGISVLSILKAKYPRARIQRSPTTDIAHEIIRKFQIASGRMCRIALIGGHDSLSKDAMQVLEQSHGCVGVFSCSGFDEDWEAELSKLRQMDPDIVIVGMGAPVEMIWCLQYERQLPSSLIMTCGGWFSFLTGEEKRAPIFAQKAGIEWMWRLVQSPKRLAKRYFKGVYYVCKYLTIDRRLIRYVKEK